MEYKRDGVSREEGQAIVDKLRQVGAKSVIVTSMVVDGAHCVMGYNHLKDKYFCLEYTEIPVHFPGTGDIFSAVLIGHLLKGELLETSTRKAMDAVAMLINLNKHNVDKNRGIPLENFLHVL